VQKLTLSGEYDGTRNGTKSPVSRHHCRHREDAGQRLQIALIRYDSTQTLIRAMLDS
jgi:hypothetical protein